MKSKQQSLNLTELERPQRLSEQVEAQLNDSIHKQVFVPGDMLPSENELASIFGVSRNVVREAMSMLATKGLIEIKRGKGAIVAEPSLDAVLDSFSKLVNYKCGDESLVHILSVRQILEPTVAALAARHRNENDLEKISRALEFMNKAGEDRFEISRYDISFHIAISQASNNPLIPIVLEPLFHVLSKYHPPIFYDRQVVDIALEYHTKIYEAILNQDTEGAHSAMKEHLRLTEKHNLRLYREIKS